MVPAYKQVMDEEMVPLVSQGIRDLVSTLKGAVVVGCSWSILRSIARMGL